MDDSKSLAVRAPEVRAEDIDGEIVIISFASGAYYSLRGTAADVWRHLTTGRSVRALRDAFGGDDAAEFDAFVADLFGQDLVVAVPASVDGTVTLSGERTPLVLERFDEMREMLLYDPIHDVDDTGWPHLPGTAAGSAR